MVHRKSVSAVCAVSMFGIMFSMVPASAQDFPTRPVTIIVPSSPGGPAYVAARLISDRFSEALKQPVIVDVAPGAGGTIGMARVARAAPDGYTLMLHQTGYAIAPALYNKLPFDTAKDFSVVGMVNSSETFIVGRKSLPANNFKELVEWMKGPGKPARVAHPGAGSRGFLVTSMLVRAIDAESTLIAYKGIGPALNDLLGEHIDVTQAGSSAAAPHIEAGLMKLYATTGFERNKQFPDIPTLGELGYEDLRLLLWMGLFAPSGTPQPVLEKLNAALRETIADEKVLGNFKNSMVDPFPDEQMTLEGSRKFIDDELDFWAKIVREHNFKMP